MFSIDWIGAAQRWLHRNVKVILLSLFLATLLFSGYSFWNALKPSLSAIAYLEGKGYTSARIVGNLPEGRGCKVDDAYRYSFDAIPPSGKKRVEGIVCGGDDAPWYEEKKMR